MDIKELKKLLDILKDSEVSEFEMEREGIKLKLSRGTIVSVHPTPEYAPQPINPIPMQAAAPAQPITGPQPVQQVPAAEPAAEPKEDDILNQEGIHVVNSPIVGTFYRKPNPNAGPFVDVGDKVKEGQTLCIVEAMKLMNEIASDVGGEIVKIFIEDANPVEYGEPLFAIKTR